MDAIASPLITVLANVIADILVSKGIIDSSSKVALIQVMNNSMASAMTLGVAVYSVYKVVELQKHKITMGGQQQFSQPVSQTEPTGQSGLVPGQKNNPTA